MNGYLIAYYNHLYTIAFIGIVYMIYEPSGPEASIDEISIPFFR